VKLAAIQYRPPKGNPDVARRELLTMINAAGEAGANLIVCPEMATSGYLWSSPEAIDPHAEPSTGATFQALSAVARKHHAWVVCGFPERVLPPGSQSPTHHVVALFNSAMVISPEGSRVATYRKVLLYPADTVWANPGWQRTIFPTAFGRVVPAICMDINDPRFISFVHQTQPEFIALCTNWIEEGEEIHDYWRSQLQGWKGWLIAANGWGPDGNIELCGQSAIMSPTGEVVAAAAPLGNEVVMFDIGPVIF